jgi:hypothetical protein
MAITNCQEELKTYMVHAALMEVAILTKKYRAVFYQALKGFFPIDPHHQRNQGGN